MIGVLCDQTTKIIGVNICPGYQDYINLVNSRGGVEGYKIKGDEIDIEYKVPPAVEAYQRQKAEGAVSIMLYGTPQTQALTQKLNEDKDARARRQASAPQLRANGARYPYLFPIAATYWAQGAAAIKFVKEKLGGTLEGKKIAYLFYDNPGGHEPLALFEELQKLEKFELKTFAVPPPGVEMGAQILDITQRFRPDFVITHLFGRSPSVSIKELKRNGYPLSKVVGFVWGSAEADVEAAGGWSVAEGYHTIQFAGVGDDYPVRNDIVEMSRPKASSRRRTCKTVYYNRGLLTAALHVEAIRNAIKATGGRPPTGEDVKKGTEVHPQFHIGWSCAAARTQRRRPRRWRLGADLPGQRKSSLERRIGSAAILKSWLGY